MGTTAKHTMVLGTIDRKKKLKVSVSSLFTPSTAAVRKTYTLSVLGSLRVVSVCFFFFAKLKLFYILFVAYFQIRVELCEF